MKNVRYPKKNKIKKEKSKLKKKSSFLKNKKNYIKKRKHIELEEEESAKINIIFKPKLKIKAFEDSTFVLQSNNYINETFNIKTDYLLVENNIDYNVEIPIEDSFKNEDCNKYINYYLYYNIINHKDISESLIEEIYIQKDGNCFYNCLSYFFTNTQKYTTIKVVL